MPDSSLLLTQTTPSPESGALPPAIERLRSTLPTEAAAQPAHVPSPKYRMSFPSLSSPRPAGKAKRSNGLLTLLRKPKPKWDEVKGKLRNRHRRHTSDASEATGSVSGQSQQDEAYEQPNGEGRPELKVCLL